MLLFLGIGMFATIYPKILAESCGSGESQQVNETVTAAQEIFCKSCGCYFTNMNLNVYNKTRTNPHHPELEQLKSIVTNYSDTNTSWPVNATNCEDWDSTDYPDSNGISLMEAMFSCSGWCETKKPNLIYLFTNVNQGNYCYLSREPPGILLYQTHDVLREVRQFAADILVLGVLNTVCGVYDHNVLVHAPQRAEEERGEKSKIKAAGSRQWDDSPELHPERVSAPTHLIIILLLILQCSSNIEKH